MGGCVSSRKDEEEGAKERLVEDMEYESLLGCFGRKGDEGANERLVEGIEFIRSVPLFALLGRDELPRLAYAFSPASYDLGEVVVEQGEPGEQFFIIKSGTAAVKVRQGQDRALEQVAQLYMGDFFGEEALVGNPQRSARVEALSQLEVWVLERSDFEQLGLHRKLHFKKRMAVAEGDAGTVIVDPKLVRKKTENEHEMLRQTLLANRNLRPLLEQMGSEKVHAIVDNAYQYPVKDGDVVITQGELNADLFYMIAEGTFTVNVCGRTVLELGPGGSFGELALLYRAPRAATVTATSDGTLWAVPQQHFREVVRDQVRVKLAGFTQLLGRVEIFKDMSNEERQGLSDQLVESTFLEGDYIVRQGEKGRTFFILYDGEVAMEMGGKEVSRLSGDPAQDRAEFFGERALLTDQPRAASVRVCSPKAMVLALDRDIFENVLMRNQAEMQLKFSKYLSCLERVNYSLDSLEEVGLLGTGAFGTVTLVKDRETGRTYALKALSKGLIMQMQRLKAVKMEKLVLQMTRSPFLVRLAATFNAEQHVYFLMEAALGGEIYTVYRRHRLFGSEEHARFYAACTLRGLEHLHERHIVYRDLKTENLILDAKGYCKLTDFGMATFAPGSTYTLCGTPEYMAPEVVSGAGHNCGVDWWGVGVLIYESMVGVTPFLADSAVGIFHNIQVGINAASFPEGAEGGAPGWADLVKQLCKSEPRQRLPMRKGGLANVMAHGWFTQAAFDWQAHWLGSMPAPYLPEVLGANDLSQFDADVQEAPPVLPFHDDGENWDSMFEDPRGPRFL